MALARGDARARERGGALLRLRDAVDEGADSGVLSTFSSHPSYLALSTAVGSYLDDVDQLFVPGRAGAEASPSWSRMRRAQGRLVEYMLYS